jgi:hypothetical protein
MKQPVKRTLADKLEAMADPRRNDNPHERAVAAAKLEALRAAGRKRAAEASTPGSRLTAASYARAHGIDPRRLRKALRAAGKYAPYTLEDLENVR